MDLFPITLGLRHRLGGYREHRPVAALAQPAEVVWTHEAPSETTPPGGGVHRVLPDPALNLAFRCRRAPDGRAAEPRLVVIGPKTRPFLFRFHGGHEIAAIKVKLEWAMPLLGLDPSDHLDREDDVTHALPGGERLLDALATSRSADEACAMLAGAILDRLGRRTVEAPGDPGARARSGTTDHGQGAGRRRGAPDGRLASAAETSGACRDRDLAQGLRADHPAQPRHRAGRWGGSPRLGPCSRPRPDSATSRTWCGNAGR